MTVLAAYKSVTGLRRRHNEDYVWVDEQVGLYIVADGMGGQEEGEVASKMAATTAGNSISSQLKDQAQPPSAETIKNLMIEAIKAANADIFKTARKKGQKRRMGTTIVMALVQSSVAYISHVGDSRAYLAREGTLIRLTEDDSWDAMLAARGLPANDDRKMSHVLTKALGHQADLKPSFRDVILLPQDWLLLCSDGLWNMLEDAQTLTQLQKAGTDPAQVVDSLVWAANAAGGKDNISVVAIKVD